MRGLELWGEDGNESMGDGYRDEKEDNGLGRKRNAITWGVIGMEWE